MRILLVAKSAYSGSGHPAILSGMTVGFVRGLIRAALARGDELTYVFPAFPGPAEVTFVDDDDPLPAGVVARPFSDEPIPKSAIGAAPVRFVATLADACRQAPPDVAVFVYPFPLLNLAAPVLAAAGVPFAAALRGGDGYRWLAAGEGLEHDAYRDALRQCVSVTAASSWLAEVAERAGVTVDAVVGSPPPSDGVDPEITADRSGWKRDYLASGPPDVALDPDKLWLLWSGRLSTDKRPDLAIEAFGRIGPDRWQLVLAGDGDRSLLPSPLPAGVTQVFVPPRLVPRILRATDAALHTALPGAFVDSRPASVLAATSYGVPCITVRSGGRGGTDECVAPEVLAALAVAPDGDVPQALAASIDRLANDQLRLDLAKRSAEWARDQGLWTQSSRFLEVTEQALERGAAPG